MLGRDWWFYRCRTWVSCEDARGGKLGGGSGVYDVCVRAGVRGVYDVCGSAGVGWYESEC